MICEELLLFTRLSSDGLAEAFNEQEHEAFIETSADKKGNILGEKTGKRQNQGTRGWEEDSVPSHRGLQDL